MDAEADVVPDAALDLSSQVLGVCAHFGEDRQLPMVIEEHAADDFMQDALGDPGDAGVVQQQVAIGVFDEHALREPAGLRRLE